MAYQIKAVIINEDNGKENVYYGANFYEVKAVADYFANKEAMEIGKYGCGDAVAVVANNAVYIKQAPVDQEDNGYYYGCPEHAMFGDAWFFGDDYNA